MQIKSILKLIKPLGVLLTLVSLWFLAEVFYKNYQLIITNLYTPVFLLLFVVGICLYSITLFIIVFAWRLQLKDTYPIIGLRSYFSVIAISQVGKYLPGNVFHIAGRFFMAKNLGIKTNHITNSILFETILVLISATIFGFFYLSNHPSNVDFKINISLLALVVFGLVVAYFILDVKNTIRDLLTFKKVILILVSYIFSHLFIGLILYLFQHVLLNLSIPFLLLTSGYVLSFAVGFITPGSPAGIGVREAVFLKMMLFELSESDALMLMISLRLISIVGDLVLFGVALLLKKNTEKNTEVI